MTGNLKLLKNIIEKFMGIVRFGNDHFVAITSYGDYEHGNLKICHIYYVKGLGHNLVLVGQFCDGDLEVAFRSDTCFIRNLEGDDLLTGSCDFNLYTISISDMVASSPVCLMSKATSTKSWLWHRRLSHLNFGTINQLTKDDLVEGLPKFKYDKDHLCSAYNDNGLSLRMTRLKYHYAKLGITQQFSIARTPQQNGVVERRNRTLVEAARTMLIFSKAPEYLWAEAIRKPQCLYFHVFGIVFNPSNDRDDLGKDDEPKDPYLVHAQIFNAFIEGSSQKPVKANLDDLFGPLYDEYYAGRNEEVSTNFAAPNTSKNLDTPSSSLISVDNK
ncbi:integrase, catalytic region, zinc finger, CCHC-type containing protein [Tanacetum coccineum]